MIISPDHHLMTPKGEYYWTPERVKAAWTTSMRQLEETLQQRGDVTSVVLMVGIPGAGKSTWLMKNKKPGVVYFDATFTNQKARSPIIRIAQKYGVPVDVVVMDTSLKEALRRNSTRTPDRRIPEDVLMRMHQALTSGGMPTTAEGIRTIRTIRSLA